jgi:rSAM/selenodomain-associated transferase 2
LEASDFPAPAPNPPRNVTVSMIIPCWNDAAALTAALMQIRMIHGLHEIIVADASDGEECARAAIQSGVRCVRCKRPNRGEQMNAGAAQATGDFLLFQHADTEFTQAHADALRETILDSRICGGAFHRKFDSRHQQLRWLESISRWMSRAGGTMYGDQSIFVRRTVFESLGGFANIPLMEDMEFSKRLQRSGKTRVIDPPIRSSARRHQRHGSWRVSLENGIFILLFKFGASPAWLHRLYYRRPAQSA